jgi:hypothetical protein
VLRRCQRGRGCRLRGGLEGLLAGRSTLSVQRYSSDGTPLATEFQANVYTVGMQPSPPVVASDAAGGFVVVRLSQGEDGSGYGLVARRFSSDGAALAAEFQVNVYTSDSQYWQAMARAPNGDFVVVWAFRR